MKNSIPQRCGPDTLLLRGCKTWRDRPRLPPLLLHLPVATPLPSLPNLSSLPYSHFPSLPSSSSRCPVASPPFPSHLPALPVTSPLIYPSVPSFSTHPSLYHHYSCYVPSAQDPLTPPIYTTQGAPTYPSRPYPTYPTWSHPPNMAPATQPRPLPT